MWAGRARPQGSASPAAGEAGTKPPGASLPLAQVPEQAGSSACENQPHPEFPRELERPEEQGRVEGTSCERTMEAGKLRAHLEPKKQEAGLDYPSPPATSFMRCVLR